MSDFLDNLIGRSYGLKPVAQPRLASRFEPVPGNPLLIQDQEPALESEEFSTAENEREPRAGLAAATRETDAAQSIKKSQGEEETPRDSTRRESRARTNSVADEGQRPPVEISFEMEDSAPSSDAARLSASLQTSHPQTADERRAEQKPSSSSLENKAAEQAGAANLERVGARESFAPPEQHGINAQAERNLEETSFVGEERPASNISSTGQRTRELASRTVAPTRVSAQSNVNESVEQAPSVSLESPSREAAESLQPTIRVTIGRIDVRAVMPDAKQAQHRSAPARKAHGPLSLEEYLKQRNGGER